MHKAIKKTQSPILRSQLTETQKFSQFSCLNECQNRPISSPRRLQAFLSSIVANTVLSTTQTNGEMQHNLTVQFNDLQRPPR